MACHCQLAWLFSLAVTLSIGNHLITVRVSGLGDSYTRDRENDILIFLNFSLHRIRPSTHWSITTCAMSAEPQEGSANAFARLMRPQTTSHSITSPTIIRINDGSSEGSTATDTCPDFSSAYIVKPNSSSCPSQFNSVEEHFVISKRTKGANRTYTLSAQCSFCGTFFAITNQTKMRIHLTGEKRGTNKSCSMWKNPSFM